MICRRMVLVMTLLLLTELSIPSAITMGAEDAPQEPKPTSVAVGQFHFISHEEDRRDEPFLGSLLGSKPLQLEAVRLAVANLSIDGGAELPEVKFKAFPTPWCYEVSSFDPRLPASKVLEAWRDVLAKQLLSTDTTRTSLDNQIAQERLRVAELSAKLSAEREGLTKLALTAGVELDPTVAVQKRIRLETEWQILKVEAQGMVARKDAIERQIAELAKKASAGASSTDRIQGELMKSIEARRKVVEFRHEQLTVGAQGSSVGDVEQAKDELAKAEVELARYRRSLADAAGGQRLTDLQHRLDDTAIDLAETTSKLRAIEKLADQARQHSAEVKAKRIEVELLEQDYRRARDELSQLESKLRQHVSPSVTLVPLN